MTRRVAIVGAGPGGLAAAMLLSGHGYRVTVYEKQADIGGRTSRLTLGEYVFDRGPTFLMMPSLLEELFAAVGRSLHDYVQLIRLDPLYTLQFGETRFAPSTHMQETYERIERAFPGEGAGYLSFMREEGVKFDRMAPLLQRPFGSLSDYVARDVLRALPRLSLFESVYSRLSRYFQDERLKYAFSFQAKYLGMSPWECPGAFTILSYMEHKFGLFHPIGGVNRICSAMADVIRETGGEIVTSTGVRRVLTRSGKAVGVLLDNGETAEADHVVINADFGTAVSELFAPGELKKFTPAWLARKRFSCSTYMLYLGLDMPARLPHHTVLFADDYPRNVRELSSLGTLSADASIYIHHPGATDKTMAPAGKTALYALMPVPNTDAAIDWKTQEPLVREGMLRRMEELPELRGLSSHIECEARLTPLGWRDEFGVYAGATFSLAHSLGQMMALRPHNRFEELDNCWLVGGGTHPGSGLPTIFESARISAGLLMRQDGRSVTVRGGFTRPDDRPDGGKEAAIWK